MKYVILERASREELQSAVMAWIDKGWVPQGGVSIVVVTQGLWLTSHGQSPSTHLRYYQAIIKSEGTE